MRSTTPPTKTLRAHLWLEELETRQLLSGYQPTAVEQLFLEELNDARADPAAYGASIGLDLSSVAPAQPLAFNPELVQAARLHSQDMNNRGYFAHVTPEGIDPGQRMSAAGFVWSSWGESIAGGSLYPNPSDALSALIIDAGVADLGHRRQLLALDSIFQGQNQLGIGIVQGGGGPLTNYYTIDTAAALSSSPFITGVVFSDLNGNGKYDLGEGLAGVTITVAGVGSTTTFASGGYSFAVNPGTYTVTASGGGLAAPITQTVTVGANNFRLNFDTAGGGSAQPSEDYVSKLYRVILGRHASGAEVASWDAVLQRSGMGAVVTGIEESGEARTRLVDRWYATYLGRSAGNGEEMGWVNQLERGATEEDVLAGMLGSDEFYNRASALISTGSADQRYIQALYLLLLDRSAGDGELNAWAAALPGSGRSGAVKGFLHATEYRADVVRAYYASLLHRQSPPGADEVNGWVNSSDSLLGIRVGFEGSTEFAMDG